MFVQNGWTYKDFYNNLFKACVQNKTKISVLDNLMLKGVCHEIFRVLFWHVWIDLGLYKNLWLFLIFSVEPLILYLRLKFRCG